MTQTDTQHEAPARAETRPTPGPWDFHLGRGTNPRFHIQTKGGYQIASTTELMRHSQAFEENAQREANARLMAAAPELLAALQELLDWGRNHTGPIDMDSPHDLLVTAHEAIAKAKGVQP